MSTAFTECIESNEKIRRQSSIISDSICRRNPKIKLLNHFQYFLYHSFTFGNWARLAAICSSVGIVSVIVPELNCS